MLLGGAGLSQPADPRDRAVTAGRRIRRRRPDRRLEALRISRPAGRDREQARRRHAARRGYRAQGDAASRGRGLCPRRGREMEPPGRAARPLWPRPFTSALDRRLPATASTTGLTICAAVLATSVGSMPALSWLGPPPGLVARSSTVFCMARAPLTMPRLPSSRARGMASPARSPSSSPRLKEADCFRARPKASKPTISFSAAVIWSIVRTARRTPIPARFSRRRWRSIRVMPMSMSVSASRR